MLSVDQSPVPCDHLCLCRGGMTLFPSRDLPRAAAASEQPDSNCVFLDTDPNISASTIILTRQGPATLGLVSPSHAKDKESVTETKWLNLFFLDLRKIVNCNHGNPNQHFQSCIGLMLACSPHDSIVGSIPRQYSQHSCVWNQSDVTAEPRAGGRVTRHYSHHHQALLSNILPSQDHGSG